MSDVGKNDYRRESKARLIERLDLLESRENARQNQFVEFVDASILAIQIVTKHDKPLRANDAYVKLFAFTDKDDAGATPLERLVAPHELERIQGNGGRCHGHDNAPFAYEYDALKKDGTIFPVQVFVQPVVWDARQAFQCVYIDLTQRKRAAREITAKTTLLQNIFDATPEFLSLRDAEGRFEFINNSLAAEMNMAPTDIVGKSPSDIYGENSGNIVEALTKEVVKFKQPVIQREFKSGRLSGRHFRYSVVPMFDQQGDVSGTLAIGQDVTPQKQTEMALRAHKRWMDVAFENMDQGVILYGPDMTVTAFNKQALQYLRFPEKVLFLGAKYEDIDTYVRARDDTGSREAKAKAENRWAKLRNGEAHSFEYTHADGCVIEIRRCPAPDGGFVVTHTDTTEHKRVEQALREQETLLRSILDATPSRVTLKDRDGKYLLLNQAFADYRGVTVEDLLGKTATDYMSKEDAATVFAQDQEVLNSGKILENEIKFQRPGAAIQYQRRITFPVRDAAGQITGVGSVGADITQRKRIEIEISENTTLLQTILDAAPVAISLRDTNGRFLFANKQLADETGDPPEDFLGRTMTEMFGISTGRFGEGLLNEVTNAKSPIIARQVQSVRRPGYTHQVSVTPLFNEAGAVSRILTISRDITEQKAAEAAVRQQDLLLRSILDHSPATISLVDLESRYQLVNKAFLSMYNVTEAQVIHRSASAHMSKKLAFAKQSHEAAVYRKGEAITEERVDTAPSGDVRVRLVTKFPIRDQTGAITGIGSTATDTSKLRKAEENLQAVESRLSEILRIAPEAIILTTADGTILMFNDAAENIFGYARCDLIGQPIEMLLPDHIRGAHGRHVEKFLKATEPMSLMGGRGEITGRRSDGSIFPAEASISKLETDGETILTVTMHDITERKRSEKTLRQNEENLRKILEQSPVGVAVIVHEEYKGQKSAKRLFANKALAELFGERSTEYLLQSDIADTWMDPDQHAEVRETLRSGVNLVDFEACRRHRDGSAIWVSMNTRPIFFNGRNCTMVWHFDITKRLRAEEESRKALSEAKRANRAQTEFLATMSHELRTPLNAIIGFSEMMLGQYFGALGSEKYVKYANDISSSGAHLLHLINDLLDLSKIESGKHQLNKTPFKFQEIVEECAPIVLQSAEEKGVSFTYDAPDNLPSLHADRRALKQIFLNLLSNAIKFTPKDGAVAVEVSAKDDDLIFVVRDTGVGIAAEKISTLTDPFVRGEPDPYISQEGAGLGLAIVKSLVDLHGGQLAIESTVGTGTKVI